MTVARTLDNTEDEDTTVPPKIRITEIKGKRRSTFLLELIEIRVVKQEVCTILGEVRYQDAARKLAHQILLEKTDMSACCPN